jgi:hypothetical protein
MAAPIVVSGGRTMKVIEKKRTLALLSLAALAVVFALPALSAEGKAGAWTGFITDSHCAKRGAAKEHTADCVEKCVKGGDKAQILNDADGKAYNIDGWDKVKGLMGGKVTVKGSLDEKTATIKVASATKAAD